MPILRLARRGALTPESGTTRPSELRCRIADAPIRSLVSVPLSVHDTPISIGLGSPASPAGGALRNQHWLAPVVLRRSRGRPMPGARSHVLSAYTDRRLPLGCALFAGFSALPRRLCCSGVAGQIQVGRTNTMSWELDHVFFASGDADAAEAELAAFGFAFTVRRIHAGQGTANACAVFENAFVEVLRARDPEELESDLVRPLGLAERIRWRETGACPFGLCFRPTRTPTDPDTWPFETWQYAPPYVPTGTSIPIVTPRRALSEPLVFISNRPGYSPSTPIDSGLAHRDSPRTLTRVTVHRPATGANSTGVLWFAKHDFFSLQERHEFLLDLQWDRGRQGRTHTFQPRLPIIVRS
jgi:Glyoxalase-like domain